MPIFLLGIWLEDETRLKSLIKSGRRINKYEGVLNQLNLAAKRLSESPYSTDELVPKIEPVRKHIYTRAFLPNNFSMRLLKVSRELFSSRYHLYSNGFRSAVKDLLTSKNLSC